MSRINQYRSILLVCAVFIAVFWGSPLAYLGCAFTVIVADRVINPHKPLAHWAQFALWMGVCAVMIGYFWATPVALLFIFGAGVSSLLVLFAPERTRKPGAA